MSKTAPRSSGRSHNYELFEIAKVLSINNEDSNQGGRFAARGANTGAATIEIVEPVSAAEHSILAIFISTGM